MAVKKFGVKTIVFVDLKRGFLRKPGSLEFGEKA
jgi:hypothetical protein